MAQPPDHDEEFAEALSGLIMRGMVDVEAELPDDIGRVNITDVGRLAAARGKEDEEVERVTT